MDIKTSIEKIKQNEKPRKVRMKIKNIKIAPTDLFQVPFKPEQIDRYKPISEYGYDCLFQVLTALGLRHYKVSEQDSKKMYEKQKNGVEANDAAKYLSTIFGTPIERRIHESKHKPYSKMKNGYATFVCAKYTGPTSSGHYFIVYKHNDMIYCYDPCSGNNQTYDNICYQNGYKTYDIYASYHNAKKSESMLIKSKMIARIRY
jgi:hypothetical protein